MAPDIASGPIIRTTSGLVQGVQKDRFLEVKGVPYAAPPVGPLRYGKPVPHAPWDGVRPCTRSGAKSLQGSARRGQEARPGLLSEDCLYLNITTPSIEGPPRAVILYVHGGGYLLGSGGETFQAGGAYADEDVIMVTINHRLAALGFLHVDELFDGVRGTGNLGLHDTIRALEWVQENIAAFGGDPTRVTLAGHSAGGITTMALMGASSANGLFHRAIPISCAAANRGISAEIATRVGRRVIESLGIRPGDLDSLRQLEAERFILSADLANDLYDTAGAHPFAPVIDGDLFTHPAIDSIAGGSAADLDVLVGYMGEEFRLCIFDDQGELREPPLNMGVKSAGYDYMSLFDQTVHPEAEVRAVYERALAANGRESSEPELFSAVASDYVMIRSGEAFLTMHAAQPGSTYAYRFMWAPPPGNRRVGAQHGIDIPHFFAHLDAELWSPSYQGQGDPELAKDYVRAVAAFARTGDPHHDGLPDWPEYEATNRLTLMMDSTSVVQADPDAGRRALWSDVKDLGSERGDS